MALTGSHRVGKTTLARAYAEKFGIKFLETSASAVFRELGLDPAVTYDFDTRLNVQETILDSFDAAYAKHVNELAITDRCPLDMMAYTLAEAVGDRVKPSQQERVKAYIDRCFEVTNKRFSTLVIVQPGINLVEAEGKAAVNAAYVEHMNTMVMGLSVDERIKVPHFYIPRHMTDLKERLSAVEFAVGRVQTRSVEERESLGLVVH